MRTARHSSRGTHPALVFVFTFSAILALHAPLLRLPYFWDEVGYYVPAARDLLLSGSLIPRSTPSNAHPPLVIAYLALWWKIAGYAPVVTRTAMVLAASFSLLGMFRLAEAVAFVREQFEWLLQDAILAAHADHFSSQRVHAAPVVIASGASNESYT